MFRANNDRIDFAALQDRVSIEVAKIDARKATGLPYRVATTSVGSFSRSSETTVNEQLPRHRRFFRGLKNWLWAVRYVRGAFARADQALAGVGRAEQKFDRLNERVSAVDSRISGIDSRITAAQVVSSDAGLKLETAIRDIAALKREIMFQQRRLTRLSLPVDIVQKQAAVSETYDQRLDALYVAFEDVFRGSRQDIKGRLEFYLDRLDTAGASLPDRPVLDIGCGRGEWIELLGEKHIKAYGIDVNSMMIERAVSLGLDARHADLKQHLHEVEDASRSAVTAFHVVEHLPLGTLIDLLDEALRVLVPGGVLILETPNPETMRVGATTFYNDPTHRNPIPPTVLKFLVEQRGFEEVEVVELYPFTQGLLEAKTDDAKLLNRVLFGPQDYSIIARRG